MPAGRCKKKTSSPVPASSQCIREAQEVELRRKYGKEAQERLRKMDVEARRKEKNRLSAAYSRKRKADEWKKLNEKLYVLSRENELLVEGQQTQQAVVLDVELQRSTIKFLREKLECANKEKEDLELLRAKHFDLVESYKKLYDLYIHWQKEAESLREYLVFLETMEMNPDPKALPPPEPRSYIQPPPPIEPVMCQE